NTAKIIIAFNIIFLFTSCASNNTESLYFKDYNKLLYYYNPKIDINNVDRESFLLIYTGDNPKPSSKYMITEDLEKFGYSKKYISYNSFKKINGVLKQKKPSRKYLYHNCIPEYRDILIFKKDEKIIGIVKICFECEKIFAIGINSNFDRNYSKKEFRKLFRILKQDG